MDLGRRVQACFCGGRLGSQHALSAAGLLPCRYDHFMQKEIHEQPDSILQTMRGRVAFGRKSFEDKARNAMCSGSLISSIVKLPQASRCA